MSRGDGAPSPPQPRLDIVSHLLGHGVSQVDLVQDATPVSQVSVTSRTLAIGVARVRVAGGGGARQPRTGLCAAAWLPHQPAAGRTVTVWSRVRGTLAAR
jgi:hypothetical protein